MSISLRRPDRRVIIAAIVVLALLLVALVAWNVTSVGCVPNELPHWFPTWLQFHMEIRCNA